jgi:CubicO group peptidase (beta-lactamase class C family)
MEWCAPQPYRKSVAHRILNRLAMRDSVPGTDLIDPGLALPDGLFDAEDLAGYRRTLQRIAVPYKVTGRTRADRSDLPVVPMTAGGGLVSTVRDLARLDAALDPDFRGGSLLLPETIAAAWNPAADRNGQATPMGLGWFVQFHRGERVVWHFGNVPNAYSSLIVKLPAKKITLILLANSDGLSNPFQLPAGDVTRSLFATLFLKLTT